jgi:2-desacetyl-2-hydroxyethyl bacteriochlorophyllide A dehydrogenase
MRAVVIAQPGVANLETVDDPALIEDEVMVRVLGCGICGTDMHLLHEGLPNMRYPLIPGHEPWGEIVEVAATEKTFRVGDRVAVDPSLHCGLCPQCQRGRGNLCANWGAIGGTRSGAWAEFVGVPRRNIHLLEEGFPLDCGPIIEPIACALRGINQLTARADTGAIIFGAGTMGMLLTLLLDLRGVGPILVVETNAERAKIARKLLPATIIHPEALDKQEAELVIDATGDPVAIETAVEHTAHGGTMLIFGVSAPSARASVFPYRIYEREITVRGSKAILHTFPSAVDTVRRHASIFRPLVSSATYPLPQFNDALAALQSGRAVKVVIQPNPSTSGIGNSASSTEAPKGTSDERSTQYREGSGGCQSLKP